MLDILKKNNYLKNAIYLMSDSIIKLIVGFFISVLIARYLGPKNLGKISYVLGYIGILQVFIVFGLDSIILKDLSEEKYKEEVILGSVCCFRIMMFLIVYLFGYYYFKNILKENELESIYKILGLSMIIYSFYPLKQVFQIKSLSKYQVLSSQFSLVIGVILKLITIRFFIKLENYIYFLGIISFSEVIALNYFYIKIGKSILRWRINKRYLINLLMRSYPLLFQSFAIYIYMKIDQLMIGKMLGTKELGIYSIGVNLAEMVYFIPVALANAYYPKIIENRKDSIKKYEETIIKLGSINILICLMFSIGASLLGKIFIVKVYGDMYFNSGIIFQIYSWASVFVALGVSHSEYLILESKQKYSLNATVLGAILNLILNYIFIKKIGIIGAAFSTLISQGFSCYFYYIFIKDKKNLKLRTKSIIQIFNIRSFK